MLQRSDVLDKTFHALSDATRRAIVERLSRGSASVSELAEPLAMSLSAVVQHLQVLTESGLVHSEKVGRVRTCTLNLAALTAAEHWISDRQSLWRSRFDRLGAVLAEQGKSERASKKGKS